MRKRGDSKEWRPEHAAVPGEAVDGVARAGRGHLHRLGRLAAGAGVGQRPPALGADVAGEVDEQRVVDRDKIAVVIDQRTDLVDQPRVALCKVYDTLRGCGINRRVQKDAIEALALSFEPIYSRPEVSCLKIFLVDRKPIERVRSLRDIQEPAIQFQMNHARSPARQRREQQLRLKPRMTIILVDTQCAHGAN